jgi:hypothetical protein
VTTSVFFVIYADIYYVKNLAKNADLLAHKVKLLFGRYLGDNYNLNMVPPLFSTLGYV